MGDMDFKVAGTAEGITGIQMDIKVKGLTFELMAGRWHRRATGGSSSSARCWRRSTPRARTSPPSRRAWSG